MAIGKLDASNSTRPEWVLQGHKSSSEASDASCPLYLIPESALNRLSTRHTSGQDPSTIEVEMRLAPERCSCLLSAAPASTALLRLLV